MPKGIYIRTIKRHFSKEEYPNYGNRNKVKKITLTCQFCSKDFKVCPSSKNRKYCSQKCYQKSKVGERLLRITKICPVCENKFRVLESSNQKYCSRQCCGKSMRDKKQGPRSEEVKANMKGHSGVYIRTKEHKRKIGKASKKNWQDAEFREKVTKALNRPEIKVKLKKGCSRAWEKRAESSGYPRNYLCPNFNFDSTLIFKMLDKVLHTRSRYGGTKAGEMKIGRYFMDYFNKKYQFVVEWNENSHNGYPKGYDTRKCEYILTKYANYTYITIKQSDWFKKDNLTEDIAIKILEHILKQVNKEDLK